MDDLKELKIEIEKLMVALEMKQQEYLVLTGKRHIMPIYLKTPDHLDEVLSWLYDNKNRKEYSMCNCNSRGYSELSGGCPVHGVKY